MKRKSFINSLLGITAVGAIKKEETEAKPKVEERLTLQHIVDLGFKQQYDIVHPALNRRNLFYKDRYSLEWYFDEERVIISTSENKIKTVFDNRIETKEKLEELLKLMNI